MSTYVYLHCLEHDPPLQADGESGQHLYDLPQIREDIANRVAIVEAWSGDWSHPDHFRTNTARFLATHPKCRIGIRDEYGQEHPVEPVEPPMVEPVGDVVVRSADGNLWQPEQHPEKGRLWNPSNGNYWHTWNQLLKFYAPLTVLRPADAS